MSITDGYTGLSKNTNKVGSSEQQEGISSDLVPELELSMEDEELINLKNQWVKAWESYGKGIEQKQKENEEYWLGQHFNTGKEKGPADNLIFESLETALPIMTRPKADPIVESDNTEEGNAVADKVRKMLVYISDRLSYNLKVKQAARYWALYMLGVMKVGWSMKENDITCTTIRPQKLILDPNALIEECEYKGYYIGEYIEDFASDLIARFPKKSDYVTEKVKGQMGTKIQYIMWTTDDYYFWSLDNEVLGKIKNPHWNYDQESEPQMSVDEFGEPIEVPGETVPGSNHFNAPKKPYIFLSIFNLGKHPHDDTNLIQQNIPLQDLVNKRLQQIDKNADNANNGLIVSGDSFTEEQAQNMGKSLRKGGVVWVPNGDVNAAVKRDAGIALPNFVYESLIDYRNEIRNIFGTRGSTAQGTIGEQTVGGKNIIKQQDTDRIGGGISTYLEQFSDKVFNWFVQLMYVYYDEPHMASVLGAERAREYITITNSEFVSKLLVGVKEGSMIPRDPVSQRNEAIELWKDKALDPITLFERLEFPNPRENAKQLYLWNVDPIQLFPDLANEQQMLMAQQQQEQQQMQMQSEEQMRGQEQERATQDQDNKLEQIGFKELMKQP